MVRIIEEYSILFFIYSFAGWLMESVRTIPREGKWINRGFLIGPICPIYGWGVLLITILLKKYTDDFIITFIMSILICGTLEYLTSYVMEKIFNARWWDYSNRKFNINGRICLETLIPFGILGVIIIYITNPFFLGYIKNIPDLVLHIISILFTILYIIDSSISMVVIFNLKEMKKSFKDNTEEISKKVRKILRKRAVLHIRLVKAFPEIKDIVGFNDWDKIRQRIQDSTEELKKDIIEKINEFKNDEKK